MVWHDWNRGPYPLPDNDGRMTMMRGNNHKKRSRFLVTLLPVLLDHIRLIGLTVYGALNGLEDDQPP